MNYFFRRAIKKLAYKTNIAFKLFVNVFVSKDKVICPCCKYKCEEFVSYGNPPRKNALCPKCGSLEKHRLIYLFLEKTLPRNKRINILHFAPEKCLKKLIKSHRFFRYICADIKRFQADRKEDITDLTFKENSFDLVLCSHVLEHVECDKKAMKEIFRVLKGSGIAIIQVPISNIKKTVQKNSELSIDIQKIMNMHDHVRIYGSDFKKRLSQAGFRVRVLNYYASMDKKVTKTFCLLPEKIFICYKQKYSRWLKV